MNRYRIVIKETLTEEVDVAAESLEEAIQKVQLDYGQEKIVLDYNSMKEAEFKGEQI